MMTPSPKKSAISADEQDRLLNKLPFVGAYVVAGVLDSHEIRVLFREANARLQDDMITWHVPVVRDSLGRLVIAEWPDEEVRLLPDAGRAPVSVSVPSEFKVVVKYRKRNIDDGIDCECDCEDEDHCDHVYHHDDVSRHPLRRMILTFRFEELQEALPTPHEEPYWEGRSFKSENELRKEALKAWWAVEEEILSSFEKLG